LTRNAPRLHGCRQQQGPIPVKGPSVLLTAETKIKYIGFLDSKHTDLSIAATGKA